jgi:hypothetical protein
MMIGTGAVVALQNDPGRKPSFMLDTLGGSLSTRAGITKNVDVGIESDLIVFSHGSLSFDVKYRMAVAPGVYFAANLPLVLRIEMVIIPGGGQTYNPDDGLSSASDNHSKRGAVRRCCNRGAFSLVQIRGIEKRDSDC